MSPFRLCGAYLRRSLLTTVVNVLLLALGVATVVLVLIVVHDLRDRLNRDAEGIDLVVGAKGSPLQIVLATVFHVDSPTGNIPLEELSRLRGDARIAQVIPVSLGDSFKGFHIVGTEPAMTALYRAQLRSGRLWQAPFEAVVGAEVARQSALSAGSDFVSSHGLAGGGDLHSTTPYRVVGVLAPTGRVVDRLILTGLDSIWAAHEHGDDAERAANEHKAAEITAALVRYRSPLYALTVPREINKQTALQAASPAVEATRLFSVFGTAADILRVFAAILVIAAAVSMFAALYRAMDERKYDVAILRMLGASRPMIVATLVAESLILAMIGGAAGLVLGHFVASRVGSVVASAAPLSAAAWRPVPEEAWIVAIIVFCGIGSALLPAWRAYRIDVASALAKG